MNKHISYYLGSKIIAAVLNLLTMALFVRMAGSETFGGYLVQFAWATIVYGLTLQWLRFSFFAGFREESGDTHIATVLTVSGVGLVAIGSAAGVTTAFGWLEIDFTLGLIALVTGLAMYDLLHEVLRTQLRSGAVALGVLARAVLMLAFGLVAVTIHCTPFSIALAVGLAHVGAATLLLLGARDRLGGRFDRVTLASFWRYGRPLVPAFGIDAVGLQVDRLLLSRFSSLEMVGQYGAVSDFVRQSMIVISEAIAGAYLSVARAEAVEGREDRAEAVLGQAFLAYTALTTFAAAFILRFDRLLFDTLFGEEVGAATEPMVALIVASNAAAMFRAYYFGQVLYLMPSSHQLIYSNVAHLLTALVTGVILIPDQGIAGAALAMALGHVAGCIFYIIAWRGHYALRLPIADALIVAGLALGAYLLTGLVDAQLDSAALSIPINGVLMMAAMAVAASRYNILSFNDLARAALSRFRPSPRSGTTPEKSDTP